MYVMCVSYYTDDLDALQIFFCFCNILRRTSITLSFSLIMLPSIKNFKQLLPVTNADSLGCIGLVFS